MTKKKSDQQRLNDLIEVGNIIRKDIKKMGEIPPLKIIMVLKQNEHDVIMLRNRINRNKNRRKK